MKALLLAAGLGTRLRPLTDHTPKCLVEIGGRHLLDYWLRDLTAAGVERFLINTHYLSDKVREFIRNHPLQQKVQLVHEERLLGTGGTIIANRDFFEGGPTLLAHADNLCITNWGDFFAAHETRPRECIATMMTFRTACPKECGIVELSEEGVVVEFHEKAARPPGNLANAAVYLIEPEVLREADFISNFSEISQQLLPALKGRMFTWENKDILIDIGSSERLTSARRAIRHSLRNH